MRFGNSRGSSVTGSKERGSVTCSGNGGHIEFFLEPYGSSHRLPGNVIKNMGFIDLPKVILKD